MKKLILLLVLALSVFTGLFLYADAMQDDVAQKVLRLHVLANSDSEADQALKLAVRDRILKESRHLFSACASPAESKAIFLQERERLTKAAEDEIATGGFSYPVSLCLETAYFPMRSYDGLTLPAGEYEAVRVSIGDAEGKNWWCVMFPPLCFVDGSISAENTAKLSEALGNDAAILTPTSSADVQIRFKVVDFFQTATHLVKEALRQI